MPRVAVIMGSASDWDTMQSAVEVLTRFSIDHEAHVVSAHRTPELMFDFAKKAAAKQTQFIIAGAGGAAHLPGMVAALTTVPVLGVPIQSKALSGLDSLLSIVQMPAGVPTATFAIGPAGATNAALFAVACLANAQPALRSQLDAFRQQAAEKAFASTRLLKVKRARSKR
jgi:5-(carboxyamino)imidazole ribonucleotide mutase